VKVIYLELLDITLPLAFTGTLVGCGRRKAVIVYTGMATLSGISREIINMLPPSKIRLESGRLLLRC